jgi:hypothetical protein
VTRLTLVRPCLAPIVALFLLHTFGTSMAVAAYVALTAVVSLVCLGMLRDRGVSLDHQ